MIVRCMTLDRGAAAAHSWLEVGRDYVVLTIEFDRRSIQYRLHIPDEPDTPALFDAKCFSIVDGEIPGGWAVLEAPPGSYQLGPSAWMKPGFWNSYFDLAGEAPAQFERERDTLLQRYRAMTVENG